MKICKIDIGWTGYDSYDAHIVVVNNTDEAIKLAQSKSADEGSNAWERAKISVEGDYTGKETEPFILLSSFNAG